MSGVRLLAPAKINLGLSVLGKRADGYHEIDTIMAMIDLADTIIIRPTVTPGISIDGMDDVPLESNLITGAIRGWCERAHLPIAYHVDVQKRIPSPAGLGGGSSDAAAAIRALDTLHPGVLAPEQSHKLAASLGADCPFFLGSACARATGTGTTLTSMPSPTGWVVLVVPPTDFAEKTAKLYGALQQNDFGTRSQIDAIETALKISTFETLPNSFSRPARVAFEQVELAERVVTEVTGNCTLSGAGPAVYSLTKSSRLATAWTSSLHAEMPSTWRIYKARFISKSPAVELLP